MFGLEYLSALVKIMWNIAFAIVTAIPTWYCWNWIIPKYAASYIPKMFQQLPYWDVAAILFLLTILGEQIKKLVPTIVSVSNDTDVG